MTNAIAFTLALFIVLLFVVDAVFLGGHMPLFLGRQFSDLIEFLSFWR
ncbi:hypothetical protein [Paracoccus aminophilus]|nr:hypothetical protein [Paracoccus aminophilus]